MTRYWLSFENVNYPCFLNLGVGVTANDPSEAASIVTQEVLGRFMGNSPARISRIDVADFTKLDEGHVLPNLGAPERHGVWFPCLNIAAGESGMPEMNRPGMRLKLFLTSFCRWVPLTVVCIEYLIKFRKTRVGYTAESTSSTGTGPL